MSDFVARLDGPSLAPAPTHVEAPGVTACAVGGWVKRPATHVAATGSDEERMELIGALEQLKGAAEGLQAGLAGASVDAQRAAAEPLGAREVERVTRSVGHQVGLARRVSPATGRRLVQLALLVRTELPRVYGALRRGSTTEWTASQVARETVVLSAEHRALIDAELTVEADTITLLGSLGAPNRARQLAAELDPAAVVKRRRLAESERRVSLRPAADGMAWLTALLPVKHGVAALAALAKAADASRAVGDPRSRGQVMADELAARVIDPGTTAADDPDAATRGDTPYPAPPPPAPAPGTDDTTTSSSFDSAGRGGPNVGVVINLIMTDHQLFDTGPESEGTAWCESYGLIDAELAREIARGTATSADRIWIRRLFTDPQGRLTNLDQRARYFRHTLRRLITLRDRTCRTPWCDAPIRHIDHVTDHAVGGQTTLPDGQGTCESCNYAKQAAGWRASADPVTGVVSVTTPSGQRYGTLPAPPPSAHPPSRERMIDHLWAVVNAA